MPGVSAHDSLFVLLRPGVAEPCTSVGLYGTPFVKILYLTDLAQKLLSLRIFSYLCAEITICVTLARQIKETKDAYVPICNKLQYLAYLLLNSLIAGPWYIRGWCLMLERRYGFHAGA